jgi:DICT domain-containing protein
MAAHASLTRCAAPAPARLGTPFAALPSHAQLRRSPKRLLVELSKQLEREASAVGSTALVAATFQEAGHFTPATMERYRALVDEAGFVAAFGADLDTGCVPGVRGGHLHEDDPVREEWDVVVLGPHFSAALLARDRGDRGVPDEERTFDYALTYDRDVVVDAARALLDRVAVECLVTSDR